MSKPTTVWLVGDDKSVRDNAWLAMTNDESQVAQLLEDLNGTTVKSIEVKPRRRRKKK